MSLRPRSWWLRRKLSKWNKNFNLSKSGAFTWLYLIAVAQGPWLRDDHVHVCPLAWLSRTINIWKDLKFLSKFIQGALLLERKENCLQDKNNNILGQETHTSVNRHGNSIKFRKNWLTPRAGRPIWTKEKTIFKFEVE